MWDSDKCYEEKKKEGKGIEMFGRMRFSSGGQRRHLWESEFWVQTCRKGGSQPCGYVGGRAFQAEGIASVEYLWEEHAWHVWARTVKLGHSEQESECGRSSRERSWGWAVQILRGLQVRICRLDLLWVGAGGEELLWSMRGWDSFASADIYWRPATWHSLCNTLEAQRRKVNVFPSRYSVW